MIVHQMNIYLDLNADDDSNPGRYHSLSDGLSIVNQIDLYLEGINMSSESRPWTIP